jgi:hypothetical protein
VVDSAEKKMICQTLAAVEEVVVVTVVVVVDQGRD